MEKKKIPTCEEFMEILAKNEARFDRQLAEGRAAFEQEMKERDAAWEKRLAQSEAAAEKRTAEAAAAAEKRAAEAAAAAEKRDKEKAEQDAKRNAERAKQEAERAKRDAEFEEQRKKLHAEIFGVAQNIGHHAEQYFQNALAQSKTFGGEIYDKVIFNLQFKGRESCEFDIFLVNGTSVAIIEAKNRIHPHFIAEIAEKKTAQFRRNFHEYANYRLYLGVAGFSFDKTVEEEAKKYGVGIIRQVGDSIEIDDAQLKVY